MTDTSDTFSFKVQNKSDFYQFYWILKANPYVTSPCLKMLSLSQRCHDILEEDSWPSILS